MGPMGHRSMPPAIALLLLLLVPCTARADEVVWFKSGSFLRVASHTVEGDMIRVRLDSNASMAFPVTVVEKVEKAEGTAASAQTVANQSFPSEPQAPRQNGGFDPGAAAGGAPQGPLRPRPMDPSAAKGVPDAQGAAAGDSLIDRFSRSFGKPAAPAAVPVPGSSIDTRNKLPIVRGMGGSLQSAPVKEAVPQKPEDDPDPKK